APAGNPNDRYFVSYGIKDNAIGHGVEFKLSDAKGVIVYTVNKLLPNTKYYFRVRGGNGCTTGDWSQTLIAKTVYGKVFAFSQNSKSNPLVTGYTVSKKLIEQKNNSIALPSQKQKNEA